MSHLGVFSIRGEFERKATINWLSQVNGLWFLIEERDDQQGYWILERAYKLLMFISGIIYPPDYVYSDFGVT